MMFHRRATMRLLEAVRGGVSEGRTKGDIRNIVKGQELREIHDSYGDSQIWS